MSREAVRKLAGSKIVAYKVLYVKIAGGATNAIMLSQFCYWDEYLADENGWFQKTQEEIETETGLTRHEQDSAKRKMISLGLIQTKKKGIPMKMFYRIDWDVFERLLSNPQPISPPLGEMEESTTYEQNKPQTIDSSISPENGEISIHDTANSGATKRIDNSKDFKELLSLSTREEEKPEIQPPTLAEKVVEMLEAKMPCHIPPANDPKLVAYLEAGLTFEEISSSADWCAKNGKKSFEYVMKRATERRKEAAEIEKLPPKVESKPAKVAPSHASHIPVEPEPKNKARTVMPDSFKDTCKTIFSKPRGE